MAGVDALLGYTSKRERERRRREQQERDARRARADRLAAIESESTERGAASFNVSNRIEAGARVGLGIKPRDDAFARLRTAEGQAEKHDYSRSLRSLNRDPLAPPVNYNPYKQKAPTSELEFRYWQGELQAVKEFLKQGELDKSVPPEDIVDAQERQKWLQRGIGRWAEDSTDEDMLALQAKQDSAIKAMHEAMDNGDAAEAARLNKEVQATKDLLGKYIQKKYDLPSPYQGSLITDAFDEVNRHVWEPLAVPVGRTLELLPVTGQIMYTGDLALKTAMAAVGPGDWPSGKDWLKLGASWATLPVPGAAATIHGDAPGKRDLRLLETSWNSMWGNKADYIEFQREAAEVGITARLVGALVADPFNLMPVVGFTHVDDFVKAIKLFKEGVRDTRVAKFIAGMRAASRTATIAEHTETAAVGSTVIFREGKYAGQTGEVIESANSLGTLRLRLENGQEIKANKKMLGIAELWERGGEDAAIGGIDAELLRTVNKIEAEKAAREMAKAEKAAARDRLKAAERLSDRKLVHQPGETGATTPVRQPETPRPIDDAPLGVRTTGGTLLDDGADNTYRPGVYNRQTGELRTGEVNGNHNETAMSSLKQGADPREVSGKPGMFDNYGPHVKGDAQAWLFSNSADGKEVRSGIRTAYEQGDAFLMSKDYIPGAESKGTATLSGNVTKLEPEDLQRLGSWYRREDQKWVQVEHIEGDRYVAELQRNLVRDEKSANKFYIEVGSDEYMAAQLDRAKQDLAQGLPLQQSYADNPLPKQHDIQGYYGGLNDREPFTLADAQELYDSQQYRLAEQTLQDTETLRVDPSKLVETRGDEVIPMRGVPPQSAEEPVLYIPGVDDSSSAPVIVAPGTKPEPNEVQRFIERVRGSGIPIDRQLDDLISDYELALRYAPAAEDIRAQELEIVRQMRGLQESLIESGKPVARVQYLHSEGLTAFTEYHGHRVRITDTSGDNVFLEGDRVVKASQLDTITDEFGRPWYRREHGTVVETMNAKMRTLEAEQRELNRRLLGLREEMYEEGALREEALKEPESVVVDNADALHKAQEAADAGTGKPPRLTPEMADWDTNFRWALRRTGSLPAQGWRKIAHGPLRRAIYGMNPAIVQGGDVIGQYGLTYGRQIMNIQAITQEGWAKVKAVRNPFTFGPREAGEIEERTGYALGDVVEYWRQTDAKGRGNFREMFIGEQDIADYDAYVDVMQQWRKDTLEDMKKLGINTPEAWQEYDHVFRTAISKEGISFFDDGGAVVGGKPGSLRRRMYDFLTDSISEGNAYMGFEEAQLHGATSLRIYAAQEKLATQFRKLGLTEKQFIGKLPHGQAAIEAERVAAWDHLWAQRAHKFVKDNVRGTDVGVPYFRTTKAGQSAPDEIRDIVREADSISREFAGKVRRDKIKELLDGKADDILQKYRARHLQAKGELAKLRGGTQKRALPNRFFNDYNGNPRQGNKLIKTAQAGPQQAKLGGRIFDAEDLKKMARFYEKDVHKWQEAMSQAVDLFRGAATGFDPGFGFIHGLGIMGLDFARATHLRGFKLEPSMLNALRNMPGGLWVRDIRHSVQTFFRPGSVEKYWTEQFARYPEDARLFAQHVGVMAHADGASHEVLTALQRGGWVDKMTESKVLPVKLFGMADRHMANVFANFLDFGMWEAWKAMRPIWESEAALDDLGDFIRNMVGLFSPNANGISHWQRQFERTWLMWAPSYTRAMFALMAKAPQLGTVGGRLAMKGLAGMTMASMSMLAVAQLTMDMADLKKYPWEFSEEDWKRYEKTLRESIGFTSPSSIGSGRWMALRIGDNYVGVGGAARSTINLLGKMSVAIAEGKWDGFSPIDPDSKLWINTDNILLNWMRGKAPPTSAVAYNVLTGEDFLGHKLDSPIEYVIPQGLSDTPGLPFAIGGYMQANGSGVDKAKVGTAEFMGFRTFPVSNWDMYKEAIEDADPDERPFDEISDYEKRTWREDEELYPHVASAWERYAAEQRSREDKYQLARDRKKEQRETVRDPALAELAARTANVPGGAEIYSEGRAAIMAASSEAARQIERDLDIPSRPNDDNEDSTMIDQLISQWYAVDINDRIYQTFNEETGAPEYNWERFFADRRRLEVMLPEDIRKDLKDPSKHFSDPAVVKMEERRLAAQETLNQWFDLSDYNGLTPQESSRVDAAREQASEFYEQLKFAGYKVTKDQIIQAMVDMGQLSYNEGLIARILNHSAIADYARNPAKEQLLLSNPDTVVWYGWVYNTLSDEQKARWGGLLR